MIREQIQSTPEYQQTVADATSQQQQAVGVDAWVSLEKGDVEFCLQVAQVILLLLILREVSA